MSVAPSVTQQQLVSGERLGGGGLAWKITGILPARFGGTEGNRLWTNFCIGNRQGRAKAGLGTQQKMNFKF